MTTCVESKPTCSTGRRSIIVRPLRLRVRARRSNCNLLAKPRGQSEQAAATGYHWLPTGRLAAAAGAVAEIHLAHEPPASQRASQLAGRPRGKVARYSALSLFVCAPLLLASLALLGEVKVAQVRTAPVMLGGGAFFETSPAG